MIARKGFFTSKTAFICWLLASIFYAYQYILRALPNIILNDILTQFDINAMIFGQFSGVYYIGYCALHIPIGILLDRIGPRKIMTACALLISIGCLPIIFAKHWLYAIIGRFLIGAGSSAAILCVFKIIRMLFQEDDFAKMLSYAVTIGLLGAIFGGAPISYFCSQYGYRAVVIAISASGAVFAIIAYYFVPDVDGELANDSNDMKNDVENDAKNNIKNDVKNKNTKNDSSICASIFEEISIVLKNKNVLILIIASGLMIGPLEGFADAWGSEFFKIAYNLNPISANYFTSMIYFGMFLAPLLNKIAEKTGRYVTTIAFAGCIMMIIFVLLVTRNMQPNQFMIGSLFVVGTCSAYQILSIYKASTYVPENLATLATAIANMLMMLFGYFFHTVIGYVVSHCKSLGDLDSVTYGVSMIPVSILIGLILLTPLIRSESLQSHHRI